MVRQVLDLQRAVAQLLTMMRMISQASSRAQ